MNEAIRRSILPIAAVVVALLGGIPGIINIINHFKTTKLDVQFDEKNSIACYIKRNNNKLDGKLSLLLYRLTITGKGLVPSYVKTISLYLKVNKRWLDGENFIPTEYSVKDKNDVENRCLVLIRQNADDKLVTFLGSWKNFRSGEEKLEYGQPLVISQGAVFDISYDDYDKCEKIKILVTDYLGNRYAVKLNSGFAFNSFKKHIMLYHDVTDTGIESVEVAKQIH